MSGADASCGEDMSEAAGEGGDLSCNGGYLIGYNRDSANLDPQGAQCPAQKIWLSILQFDPDTSPIFINSIINSVWLFRLLTNPNSFSFRPWLQVPVGQSHHVPGDCCLAQWHPRRCPWPVRSFMFLFAVFTSFRLGLSTFPLDKADSLQHYAPFPVL